MTNDQLVTIVAKKANLTKRDTKKIMNILFSEIANDVKNGGAVRINDFGSFALKKVNERTYKGIIENTVVEEHNKVFFRPCSKLNRF